MGNEASSGADEIVDSTACPSGARSRSARAPRAPATPTKRGCQIAESTPKKTVCQSVTGSEPLTPLLTIREKRQAAVAASHASRARNKDVRLR